MELAVVGLGSMGMIHLRTARQQIEAVERVVCVTSRPERFAGEEDVATVASVEELVSEHPVDAAVVAVPASLHYEVALALLEAGIPTLLEKPFTATLAQAESLTAAARASGTLLLPGHSELFNPVLAAARPYLSQRPRALFSHKMKAYEERSVDVGTTLNTMYHDLYMVKSFDWFDPGSMALNTAHTSLNSGYDDIAIANWQSDDLVVHLHADRLAAEPIRTWDVLTRDKLVSIDFKTFGLNLYPAADVGEHPPSGRTIAAIKDGRQGEAVEFEHYWPITAEQEHFLACVRGEAEPRISLDDALETMRLAAKIGRLDA